MDEKAPTKPQDKDNALDRSEKQTHDADHIDGPKVHFVIHDEDQDYKSKKEQELKHRKDLSDETSETEEEDLSRLYQRGIATSRDQSGGNTARKSIKIRTNAKEELPGISPEDIDLVLHFFTLDNAKTKKSNSAPNCFDQQYATEDRALLVIDTGSYNKGLEKCFQGLCYGRQPYLNRSLLFQILGNH